jgi:hypothetical protein
MFIIGTTSNSDVLTRVGIADAFNVLTSVPMLSTEAEINEVRPLCRVGRRCVPCGVCRLCVS